MHACSMPRLPHELSALTGLRALLLDNNQLHSQQQQQNDEDLAQASGLGRALPVSLTGGLGGWQGSVRLYLHIQFYIKSSNCAGLVFW